MTDANWTNDDVQGFVTRLEAFYGELSETERAMFIERLVPAVDATDDVAGFAARGEVAPVEVISEHVTAFLKSRA